MLRHAQCISQHLICSVKFVRHTKEIFYCARKNLRNVTTMDLGYILDNNIYVTESLTEKNRLLFRECLNVKKMKKIQVYLDYKWKNIYEEE